MLQFSKVRSENGSAVLGFALGAPLVLLMTLGIINVSAALWSREVASNLLQQMTIQASREGANLNAISQKWQRALSESRLDAQPIEWELTTVGASTRVIKANARLELMTVGLPIAQFVVLQTQVVVE
jgi:Flp pilus assembly protein TadG